MPLPRLLTTPSFRRTALSAALFSLSSLLVFGLTYWSATSFMARQADNVLSVEMASLKESAHPLDGIHLADQINQRLASPSTREFKYLLQAPDGRLLAGNLPPMIDRDGWNDLVLPPPAPLPVGAEEPELRGLGEHLADGAFLLVANDVEELDDVSDFMENAFAIGFVATLIIAFASGGMVSAGFLRRLDAIIRTSREIMAGDLHRRIPLGSGNDDFALLSVNLNHMLARIQQLMEGVQQVTNDIAHDLRTPLSRLRHRLEHARLAATTPAEFQAAIDDALAETDGLLETFGAMLRIAQIESGARRAGFVSVDLSALITLILETYLPVAEDCNRQLVSDVVPGLTVAGDRRLLAQLAANLVENALRHTREGAIITVALQPSWGGGGPILSIADDGPGIPEAERDRVFQRFYRLDASRTTPGSGLGLSMVAAIATLHHAEIALSDNEPGLRVTVKFSSTAR